MAAAANLDDVSSVDLMTELLRRMKCTNKPDKRLILVGKIRPCPSINPGCVLSNHRSSSFAFPWRILGYSSNSNAIQQLQDALVKTQKNVKIQPVDDDTPLCKYLKAEMVGGFGQDVVEFLVNGDVVSFRDMATKVTFVYPFTTAFGDSKGQEERVKMIVNELGWYAPSFDSMD
ncbi:hypothetical protein CASFOL_024662 [Castilleja foliolosa]|uniref:Uncharacterized protein n=1 Tax=Castilleja foliolosa TaxID=1961234 RepID=A0ABD3CNZ9_9LAMI